MIKDIDIPKTIGELIDIFSQYPKDTNINISVTELNDYGFPEETPSQRMQVNDDWPDDTIFLTFGYGMNLP